MLDTAYHKVCSVGHTSVADLDSGLLVSFGRFSTHLDFIIIVKVLLFVVTILCFHVWQDERKMGIAVTVTADSSFDGSRSKQVEISVPSDQEVNILLLRYQIMQELVKAVFGRGKVKISEFLLPSPKGLRPLARVGAQPP